MKTVCHEQLSFASLKSKSVVASFDGGTITSDAGSLVLREIDSRTGIIAAINDSIADPRQPFKIRHAQAEMIGQRVFAIAQGYEDVNDHQSLRSDPVLKVCVGRSPGDTDLASQPTLCRLENRVGHSSLRRLSEALFSAYLKAHPGQRDLIVLDVDSTDDETHGHQQMSFFHGYYDQHMYHPLLVFDGLSGFPIAAVLRPGNAHASRGAVGILKRIITRLLNAYPEATILVRADAGFAIPAIYELFEAFDKKHGNVKYVIGLITNDRLRERVSTLSAKTTASFNSTGEKQRNLTSFRHKANSWTKSRRVVAKVEHLEKGLNTRFVVTNLNHDPAVQIYDGIYTGRGDVENRIKELKNHLKADRLSCSGFLANQFRFLLHTFAYTLLWHLRENLKNTDLATASMETIRLKLLKIGARVKESVRRVVFSMPTGFPYKNILAAALDNIRLMPLRA